MQSYSTLIMIALMVFAFYFLILRPQKKRQQAIQNTLSSLQPGSRVLLGSGLFGTIVSIGDRQAVLEISPGVELTVLKQAIVRTATEADEDTVTDDEYDDDEVLADPQGLAPRDTLSGEPVDRDGSTAVSHDAERPTPSAGADPQRPS
ncbi:MAG: Preprotein translocase subunit YajC [uncultured Friedmanniella sp.]|uniref:Preprotein translocase subunit YajC n=1 Tax=uncultured Friedmanniella sp. TaxID=335381 RepID=A0A6J4L999_9ACTN|nr:MAG: Preprotein translocase subunit YajC [uncultured Friedmanniella sp.]